MTRTLFLALLLLLSLPVTAGEDPRRAVAAVLDTFHRAAARGDFAAYFDSMTEDAVFLGTEAGERWQGQAFRDFARPRFAEGGWRYEPRRRSVQVDARRGVAWFDELLHNDKLGPCHGSGVLLRGEQGWRIAQYNLSVLVPNDLVFPLAEIVKRYESRLPTAAEELPGEVVEPWQDPAGEGVDSGEERPDCRQRKRHKTNWRADCGPQD